MPLLVNKLLKKILPCMLIAICTVLHKAFVIIDPPVTSIQKKASNQFFLDHYHARFFVPKSLSPMMPLIAIATVNIPKKRKKSDVYYRMTQAIQMQYAKKHGYDLFSLQRPFSIDANRKRRRTQWQKLPSTQFLLNMKHPYLQNRKYDYIFWVDGDTMIMNFTLSLFKDIIAPTPPGKSIIVTGDTLIVNSAQVLWKNSPATTWFLNTLWNMFDERETQILPLNDNGYMASMLGGCLPNNSAREKAACYERVNFWPKKRGRPPESSLKRKRIAREISVANITSVIHLAPWARKLMHWGKKRSMNSYSNDYRSGDFLFHAAGPICKHALMHKRFQESMTMNQLQFRDLIHQGLFDDSDLWMLSTPPEKCRKTERRTG
mmetsp:Transcript_4959/g.13883  ORF Transcript_4959/g.13883 Transcript_4959/m.13883 type:complete len:376 (-) Transcript_4959:827-1954(-)